MSWDIFFMASNTPPPPVADMPEDWSGNRSFSLADLRGQISSILPQTDWSELNWGNFRGNGCSLEFNIGEEDPTGDFAVHVHGGGDAAATIQKIAELPDWYAIVEGEWLHHGANLADSHDTFQNYRD